MAEKTDANNVFAQTSAEVVRDNYQEKAPRIQSPALPGRIAQQQILPNAVANRLVRPLQYFARLSTPVVDVPNGASAIFSTTVRGGNRETIVQHVSRQLYIDGTTIDNRMPEVISSSLYPTYEWDALYDDDGFSIRDNPWIAVHKIQIRNNSGVTRTIAAELFTKYIVNGDSASA